MKPIIVADMLSTAGAKTSLADISGMTAAVQGFLNNVVAAAGYGAAVETPEQLKQSVAAAIGPRHSMELPDNVPAAAAAAAAPAAGSGGSDGGMAAMAAAAVADVSSSDEEEDEKNTFHLAPATSSDVAAATAAAAAAGSNGAAADGAAAGSSVRDAAARSQSSAASTGHAAAPAAAGAAATVSQGRALLLKDAFLVFRALCKLSIRTSDSVTITDPTAVRGKVGAAMNSGCVCLCERALGRDLVTHFSGPQQQWQQQRLLGCTLGEPGSSQGRTCICLHRAAEALALCLRTACWRFCKPRLMCCARCAVPCCVMLQLLALELLKVLLENSGPTFRSNERFTAGQLRPPPHPLTAGHSICNCCGQGSQLLGQ